MVQVNFMIADVELYILSYFFQDTVRYAKELAEIKSNLTTKTADLVRLEELHDRVAEDKKRLSHRVNKLMANGRGLYLFLSNSSYHCSAINYSHNPLPNNKNLDWSELKTFCRRQYKCD